MSLLDDHLEGPWPRVLLAGLPADLLGSVGATEIITQYATGEMNAQLAVVSANLDHVHHFRTDRSWRQRTPATGSQHAANGGQTDPSLHWLTLLDGAPLVHKVERMTGNSWPKLSGSDMIHPLLELAAKRGWRVGFLGGAAETHARLKATLATDLPALVISDCWAPDRSVLNDNAGSSALADEIAGTNTDILVVGLGKPLQEQWIHHYGATTGAKVLLAFGAVVDFLAGRVQRAPKWVADMGGEWLWRLSQEPKRLARRYLVQGPPAYVHLQRESIQLERISQSIQAIPTQPRHAASSDCESFTPVSDRATVCVIVVTHNSAQDLPLLFKSLRNQLKDQTLSVVVCDNASTDGTLDELDRHRDITVVTADGNLGYAGGINVASSHTERAESILILNPDLEVGRGAIGAMLARLRAPGVGLVVPRVLDADGGLYPSLRREPTVLRALGDAAVGRHFPGRPSWLGETDHRRHSYDVAHQVDWATGAAFMIRREAADAVGAWNEEFFLYSEETDFCRRLRDAGYQVWYDPAATVRHRGAGSGSSADLNTLMAVNRVRYAERHKNRVHSVLFRGAVVLAETARSYDPKHRRTLGIVVNRWGNLPQATKSEQR